MHVLYLHQYFGTPSGSGAARSYEFARRLVEAGHTVTVVAARRLNNGLEDLPRQVVDGIEVLSLGGQPYSNRMPARTRILEWIRFTWRAMRVRPDRRPDVVIATSTPLTIGIPGARQARRFQVPFVFEVRDLWPQAPIEMGALRNPVLIWIARRLERWIYRRATSIIALSPGMEAGVLEAGVDREKVVTIPNASDPDSFHPQLRDRAILGRWGIESDFVCVHAGTMGPANGLDYLVDAAAELAARDEHDIRILILGDGGMRPQLERRVGELGLTNVVFGGIVRRVEVGPIVASCDVAITSFADVPILATNSPNKFFDALASGVPVIVNSRGWTRDIVHDNDAGCYVDVRRPQELADALVRLRDSDDTRARQGANARELATSAFARDLLAAHFREVLENAVAGIPARSGWVWEVPSGATSDARIGT